MPPTLLAPVRAIALMALLALLVASTARIAHAQFLPGASAPEAQTDKGLGLLLEEARKDGATVIVVRPGEAAQATRLAEESAALPTQILTARARVKDILASALVLWPNIKETFRLASPQGGYTWLVRALGTGILGFFVGWVAITRIQKAGVQYFIHMWNPAPKTTADKAKYLLFRVVLALVYAGVFFLTVMAVVIIFDPDLPASRRLIFEGALAYAMFRVMRRGVAWNLFVYDAPSHRLVNLDDDEAIKMDRDWGVAVAVVLVFMATARFLRFAGSGRPDATLTPENVLLLQLCSAAVVVLAIVAFTLRHWKPLQHIFAPRDPEAWMHRVRTALAGFAPGLLLLYSALAFVMFVVRLALGQPDPGLVIAAPFVITFVSMIAFGFVLIVIQSFYDRRVRGFRELAQAERAKHEREAALLDEESGEVMVAGPAATRFEYQPMFRSFFENASLAIIGTVALGELGRTWGAGVTEQGGPWAAFLDIVLASVLCWLCYRAISIFIDNRIAQEGGAPDDEEEEIGGEGGGAGASRMATLLPIIRYMMIIVVFSTAGMVILSTMGFDIGPIFAGAGVVGIAVGFGAQTLIRDIFSGAFFLMDDAFRKGEYVQIGNTKGTVEKISIRSFQLRHHLGGLHTIPFGEVKQLTNFSRDWVMTKLPLRVTYDTDVDKVRNLIKKLGQRLLEDPQIGHTFMQPLKSQGVYKMEDSAMIIRVKFMTKPGEQFVARKMIYEAIQQVFAEAGIRFAHREVTVRLADGARVDDLPDEQRRAATAAARSVIDAEAEAEAAGGKASGGG